MNVGDDDEDSSAFSFDPDSGIHPTLRCLEEGEEIRLALLELKKKQTAKRERVSSLPPPLRPLSRPRR